ncbi:Bacterial Ig-like domain (group 2) [Sporotomaculum syntrophicum]|uniref:Bacterial Ig-like domain (Group 2) n=1 Tax=Sporotomaculum syntrophicum TaxID=182264 RepID=A0A9D3AYT0_9FIRM|nr:FN3 associated domain-containing protein [Sporotomaculum syntrophicum]KAF1085781.1 Bacterial Ig-like domain (group 2) [Sporotomaculum syntrophicum]
MQVSNRKFLWNILIVLLSLLLLASLFNCMPTFAIAETSDVLEITGDGVANHITLNLAELSAMKQYEHVYSTINTWPSKRWYVAKGVNLRELLALAGIKDDAKQIKFISNDGYDVTLTVKELLEDKRYYFPGLKDNHSSDGSIPGSSEGAVEVEPVLALVSAEGSDNPDDMNDRDALLLVMGQRAVTEQTNNLFLKYVSRIEVLTVAPEKWDSPKANIPSGMVVPVGTEITLSNKNNNEDKIYYTTDGSTPTVNSPMFNWSASRWWPLRDDVEGVNQPIKVEKDTVIKMKTIGPGKEDSDVVTFTFTADLTGKAVDPTKVPGGPPTGVTLDRSTIDRPVGSTFKLEANVAPFNATDQDVIWSSSDTSVATVDNHGLVTVIGPGTAVITVTTVAGNHTATCIVNGPDEGESVQGELPIVGTQEVQIPEPPVAPSVLEIEHPDPAEPEPVEPEKEVEPDIDLTASERMPETSDKLPVPESRGQYLAEKEDLDNKFAIDAALEQPSSQVWEVSQISTDTVPLPLQETQNLMDVYAAGTFLLLLFSGAGKRYAEYVKER